jgi:hypothetical protein
MFKYQKQHARNKKDQRSKAVVMFSVPVEQGKSADQQSNQEHSCLKINIIQNVNTKQWQGANKQGQQSTMNCAGNCGRNT